MSEISQYMLCSPLQLLLTILAVQIKSTRSFLRPSGSSLAVRMTIRLSRCHGALRESEFSLCHCLESFRTIKRLTPPGKSTAAARNPSARPAPPFSRKG